MRSGMLKAKCSMQVNPLLKTLRSFFSAANYRWLGIASSFWLIAYSWKTLSWCDVVYSTERRTPYN